MENEEVEYAGFWIRVGASLIDGLLFAMITIPLTIGVYGYDQLLMNESWYMGPADFIINTLFPAVAVIMFWIYKSATPGKMVLGLRIVDAGTGDMLSTGQAIGRYLAYLPAMIPLLLGIFWVGWDSRKQGWHDKLASTVVIRNKNSVEPVQFESSATIDDVK